MGKVYKAHDATLDRHVAIKILPAELVADASRVGRFMQEARAASGLNHPHVLTVYDIGEADEVRYIAMELIDGKTVREQLLSGQADLRKSLKLVLQVAEALTAAHAAGIIHRDLKPENIMVTPAGYAKVLDFGLAKLRRDEAAAGEAESKTAVRDTEPGVVMGTVGYMSPEQARGEVVDQRSDIFSLGCILYELVSGRRAFRGDSSVDTLHKILYSEPEAIRTLRADAPPELVRITRKALAKDPNDRYQSARDLAIDLRELLREIDSNPSGALEPLASAKPVRKRLLPWVAAILAVIAAAAAAWIWRGRSAAPAAPVANQLRVTRVTASGKVIAAAISPDGKFVAYNVSDQGEQSLWVRQMGSSQSLELIPMGRRAYWGLSFSPDGDIFFGEKIGDSRGGAIHRISPLGGAPRKIIENIDSPPTFSPDGKQLAFLRAGFPSPTESSIIVAGIDGSREKVLVSVKLPDRFVPVFFGGASWSPDGKQLATALLNRTQRAARVVAVDIASGAMTTISDAPWVQVAMVAWLPDGKGLVAIASDGEGSRSQVWYLPYPKGAPVQITNDLFDYRIVSLTADGKSLLTVASDATADVWVIPNGGELKKLTKAKLEGAYGVDSLPDGRIVFTSLETGKLDVWSMNADGSGRMLLTRDEHENRLPVASPDGKFIVYVSITSSSTELCRMDVDGSNRRVLATTGVTARIASISPDSKWVAYTASQGGTFNIARVPAGGGVPVFLTESGASDAMYSPDGSQLAAYFHEGGGYVLGILPAEGGKPLKRFQIAPPTSSSKIDWMPDGSALVINTAPSDRANLWRIPIDGSAPARITNFDEHLIMGYARLPSGKGWVVSRGDLSRDAVLITGFRP